MSEHQAGLDFSRAPLDFVVLRTTDGTYRDGAFSEHFRLSTRFQLPTSAYHYLRSPREGTTIAEQVDAAVAVLDAAGAVGVPMWIDVESPAGLSRGDVAAAHDEFSARGIPVAGVYTTTSYWRRHMLLTSPAQFGALWLAHWGANPIVDLDEIAEDEPSGVIDAVAALVGTRPTALGMPTPAMWQCTSRALIDGVEVDLNLAF
nr:GH25 family lysozyme [Corynebacterium aquatimens]